MSEVGRLRRHGRVRQLSHTDVLQLRVWPRVATRRLRRRVIVMRVIRESARLRVMTRHAVRVQQAGEEKRGDHGASVRTAVAPREWWKVCVCAGNDPVRAGDFPPCPSTRSPHVNLCHGREQTGCGNRPRAAHAGSQIRRSNGIRRNTAALSPNDAVELSKVTMTNLSGAGAVTPCLMVWASRHSIVSVESGCTDTPRLAARLD